MKKKTNFEWRWPKRNELQKQDREDKQRFLLLTSKQLFKQQVRRHTAARNKSFRNTTTTKGVEDDSPPPLRTPQAPQSPSMAWTLSPWMPRRWEARQRVDDDSPPPSPPPRRSRRRRTQESTTTRRLTHRLARRLRSLRNGPCRPRCAGLPTPLPWSPSLASARSTW